MDIMTILPYIPGLVSSVLSIRGYFSQKAKDNIIAIQLQLDHLHKLHKEQLLRIEQEHQRMKSEVLALEKLAFVDHTALKVLAERVAGESKLIEKMERLLEHKCFRERDDD